MEKWEGKTAVVTGASAGIGDAIVRDLVKYGVNVVALARRVERLETLKEQMRNEKGKIFPIKCDVSEKASIDAAFEKIEKEVGTVQILVNNAGVAVLTGIFDDHEREVEEAITSTINTNFLGLVRVSRKAYKLMKKTDDYGIIINIGSVAGHNASLDFIVNVYPATKFAVRAVTESMRQELIKINDSKIRVCEISPGGVLTEILNDSLSTPEMKAMIENQHLPLLKSSDISQTVLFMLMTPYEVNITEMIVKPIGEKI